MTVTPHNVNDEGTTRSKAVSGLSVSVAATGAIFSCTPAGSSMVVKVHGDIDVRSAPILSDYVCSRVEEGVRLVFDLSDVAFFGIAGLTVFTALDAAVLDAGASWCLVEGHPVHRLLEAAAVVTDVDKFDSVEAALA